MAHKKQEYFTNKITEYKEKSENEILTYLSSFWNVSPHEDGVIRLYASYQKSDHKDSKGNDFAFFTDVRNDSGDILYYPYNLGKVKIWSQYKASFESQPIWQINVRLSEKKFRKENPFALSLANNIVGKPSLKFNDRLDKESYIKKLFQDTGSTEKDAKTIVNALHNIMDDLYTNADDRFVYELIQNADDQPRVGKNVSVNMQLLNKHLLFMHNGRPFDKDDIYSICDIGSSTKRNSKEKIGYKGIGFKSVFTGSDTVILNSEKYSFAFDKYSPVYTGMNIENIPWQLKPIWQEKYRYPQEVRTNEYFWESPVGISLEIDEGVVNDYDNSIRKILSNPLFLLFLKNVYSVRYQYDNNDFVVSKKTEDNIVHITQNDEIISSWTTFDFVVDIPLNIREAMQNDRNVPQKMKEATKTQISFAAKIKNGKIDQISNPVLYAYLPTSVNDFKFNFIVNADFLLAANREQLHTKKIWNQFLFQQIGELLIEWSKTLSHNSSSYLNVLQQALLVEEETGHLALSAYFNSTYKSALESKAFILNHKGELAKQDEIIIDKTGLSEIIGADLFCKLLDTEKCLPSEKIDSKILEEDIFEHIELLKFDDVIDAITNNDDFNDWYISASDEQKKALYKWIEDNNTRTHEDNLKSFVSNLPLFQFGEEYKSFEEISSSDYIVTTEHIIPIKEILSKLGFVYSSNDFDNNHPLYEFIELQNEKKLFDDITLSLLEQDGAGLSSIQKLELFLTLKNFSNIGPKHLSEIQFFNNSENQMCCLNEMFPYNENAPEWAKSYMISKEENFPEIQDYLQPEFSIIWKNIGVITSEQEIPIAVIYDAYKWTDEKYTKELIDRYKRNDDIQDLLSIVEVSRPETQRCYLENIKRLNLHSESSYKKDSYEYRVLQLALSAFEEPSNFSSKIFFDGQCIKDFSVSDDVVCEYTQHGEKKKVKMSLAKLLPQYQNQSDSIDKIKALFESKKDLDKFFVTKPIQLDQIVKELEKEENLGLKPGEWNYDRNGNAHQYLFYVFYFNGIKEYTSSWVISIQLENESDSFIHELLDFIYDNNIDIMSSPFTFRVKQYFNNKYFNCEWLFEKERLLPIIEKWANDDKKKKYLTDNGVRTEGCYALQFRKLFLENKPIDFIDKLKDDEINSGIEFIATVSGYERPFVGGNQKNILLSLKEKCKGLSDNWDDKKMEENSREWDSKEYKEWIEEHNPHILIYPEALPSQLSYKDEILLNYGNLQCDYYYNTQEQKLFVSNTRKIEDILFEIAKDHNSDLNIDDYKFLFWGGDKISVSKEDVEEKNKNIESLSKENHTLSEENRKKDKIIEELQAKLKAYENVEIGNNDEDKGKQRENLHTPTIEKGNSGSIGDIPQLEAQLEAQRRLMQDFPQWTFPDNYGEADDDDKPYNFSTVEIEDENDNTIPIVLKSYKKPDEPFKINTTEWDYLIKEKAVLLICTETDIKRIYVRDLIRKQSSIAISFSTENLDIEDKVNAFADSLHYFTELHFDFDSFNISSRVQSAKELYQRNKRAFFANDNTEDDI